MNKKLEKILGEAKEEVLEVWIWRGREEGKEGKDCIIFKSYIPSLSVIITAVYDSLGNKRLTGRNIKRLFEQAWRVEIDLGVKEENWLIFLETNYDDLSVFLYSA